MLLLCTTSCCSTGCSCSMSGSTALRERASSRQPLSLDQLIKLMIEYELHGLNDIAVDTLERFADRLKGRLDTEHAIRLLADPPLPAGFAAAVHPQRPAVGAAADAGSARSGGIGLSFRLPGSAGV
jgi:hypothetical protein